MAILPKNTASTLSPPWYSSKEDEQAILKETLAMKIRSCDGYGINSHKFDLSASKFE